MTLLRIIVVLVGGLLVLLVVVIQRAETTRLHYEIAQCGRKADELRLQLREAEMELARQRNPSRIWQRMQQSVAQIVDPNTPPAPEPQPPARRGGTRRGGR